MSSLSVPKSSTSQILPSFLMLSHAETWINWRGRRCNIVCENHIYVIDIAREILFRNTTTSTSRNRPCDDFEINTEIGFEKTTKRSSRIRIAKGYYAIRKQQYVDDSHTYAYGRYYSNTYCLLDNKQIALLHWIMWITPAALSDEAFVYARLSFSSEISYS